MLEEGAPTPHLSSDDIEENYSLEDEVSSTDSDEVDRVNSRGR